MKFVFDAAAKTGDISTTNVKAMKLSFSTREWNHSISNIFVNPTVNIRGKCGHADIKDCLNQTSFSNGSPLWGRSRKQLRNITKLRHPTQEEMQTHYINCYIYEYSIKGFLH
jgi:hypothetical protein